MIDLTKIKDKEFFEIKMLSIGGLGAYTVGQMLGQEIAKFVDIKTSVFASYSSEKKGAPVNVFLRFVKQDTPIRNYAAVKNPDFLIAFKEELLKDSSNLVGLKEDGILLVNTKLSIDELYEKYNICCKNVFIIDAESIAHKYNVKTNNVIFGAIHKVLSFLDRYITKDTIEEKLSFRYPHLVEGNINAFFEGFDQCSYHEVTAQSFNQKTHKVLGIEDQIPGGLILGANSFKKDNSISREGFIPEFNKDLCINCTRCDFTCPDDCFVWKEVEGRRGRMEMQLQGIDYQYCKGCMRCVEVCPTQALTKVVDDKQHVGVKKGYELMED